MGLGFFWISICSYWYKFCWFIWILTFFCVVFWWVLMGFDLYGFILRCIFSHIIIFLYSESWHVLFQVNVLSIKNFYKKNCDMFYFKFVCNLMILFLYFESWQNLFQANVLSIGKFKKKKKKIETNFILGECIVN